MNIACFFGFHDWEYTKQLVWQYNIEGCYFPHVEGISLYVVCRCKKCGKTKYELVQYYPEYSFELNDLKNKLINQGIPDFAHYLMKEANNGNS